MTGWDGKGIDPWLPERLAAELAITKAERRMYAEWWGSFSAWLVTVHRSVLGSNVRPDASAVWRHAPLWAEHMQTFVQGPVKDTMRLAYEALLGKGYQFDARPFVSQYLATVHNRMVRTSDEVYDLVASRVARGAARGDSIPDIAADVDEILTATATERWPSRAVTVARTETVGALNAGRHDSFDVIAEETGEELEHMWLCVAPDTPVAAATAMHAARRRYVGPLVRVSTASGRTVAVTPQHRVLTGRGWLPAQSVRQGDYLFQVVGTKPARSGAPHVQDRPAGVGQVVDAAMQAEPVKVRTVPMAVNLDDEAGHREIQVVPVDGDLAARLQAGVPQRGEDLFLVSADRLAHLPLFAGGSAHQPTGGHRSPAVSGAGACHAPGPDRLVVMGRPNHPRRAAVAARHPSFLQDADHDGGGAAVGAGDRLGRGAALVCGDDAGRVNVVPSARGHAHALRGSGLLDRLGSLLEPSPRRLSYGQQYASLSQPTTQGGRACGDALRDLNGGLAGLVAPDDVVNVNVEAFEGHVYDLSTGTEWYAADGLVIHNSTLDGRTRPSHSEADGQRVPLGTPYTVGGALLERPGDPFGPAEEVVNCRCVELLVGPDEQVDQTGRGFLDADDWWASEMEDAA